MDYKDYSEARKEGQAKGEVPLHWITPAYIAFKKQYQHYEGITPLEQIKIISATAAQHTPKPDYWERKFFERIWKGQWGLSTPVMGNMGTDRGMPVSCSGGVVHDSIDGFYTARREAALLTKYGFGTSSDLSAIRPRGTPITVGGKASGVLPVFKGFRQDMKDVSQGSMRRGAWAGYLDIDHGDFDELVHFVDKHSDGSNVGFNIHDRFIERLKAGDPEAIRRVGLLTKLKLEAGRGYLYFPDKVARQQPECYKRLGLSSKASNLCSEITLHADEDHTYTCVLSSLNLDMHNDDELEQSAFEMVVFLDCVAEEFIQKGKDIPGLEKAVRSTEKGRALGMGVLGYHTALQRRGIPFDSLAATFYNGETFKTIARGGESASRWLATIYGEPEWCKGTGSRNTHIMAVAPTKTNALMCGGVSNGISPVYANCYKETTAGSEVMRINPVFLQLCKERGKNAEAMYAEINAKKGSVQHLDWLSEDEKKVFRTAFEIPQESLVRMVSQRQKWIDQAQSYDLFFSENEDPEYISQIIKSVILDPRIKSQYYVNTLAGIVGSNGQCEVCM